MESGFECGCVFCRDVLGGCGGEGVATIEAKYWVILDICPGKFINFWNRCLAERKLKLGS